MPVGDVRFFARSGSHALAAVALAAEGSAPPAALVLTGVAPLQTAGPTEVSFLDNRRYASALERTSAGAVIVHPEMAARVPAATIAIVTIRQFGGVTLEDEVGAGANTTIARGSTGDRGIGAGSRLDNQVQIGHNVRLGRCCVIVAQVGIAGSTVLDDFVQVGGQAAIAGHLHIERGAQIGAQSGVMADVGAGEILLGTPAQPK